MRDIEILPYSICFTFSTLSSLARVLVSLMSDNSVRAQFCYIFVCEISADDVKNYTPPFNKHVFHNLVSENYDRIQENSSMNK